jgi:hypothetical protein
MKSKTLLFYLLVFVPLITFCQTDTIPDTGIDPSKRIDWDIYLYCLMGCILQEFLYWFELRNSLAAGTYPKELKSKLYWIITFIGIILFSIASYWYFTTATGDKVKSFFTIAVFAGGFPRLFKGAVQALNPPSGSSGKNLINREFTIKDYFMLR